MSKRSVAVHALHEPTLIQTLVQQSRSTLNVFLLAITRNEYALRRAQEEIDRVVGPDRLPEFANCDSLPYTNALLEEVYR